MESCQEEENLLVHPHDRCLC